MAMKKQDAADYIDPTKYLESIFPTMPVWVQQCDDYKLVWKVHTKTLPWLYIFLKILYSSSILHVKKKVFA